MWLAVGAALAFACAVSVPALAQTAAPAAEPPPVSLDRIRAGLERDATLRIPDLTDVAYFRAAIEEPLVFDTVLQAMRRDLARWPGTAITAPSALPMSRTGGGIELLGIARGIVREISERNARQRVADALREFCAAHDCSTLESGPPAIEGVLPPGVAAPQ
jgi:hypothetical protein